MDEVKRYLRYVLPGMVLVVVVFFFFILSDFEYVKKVIKAGAGKESLGFAFALLLGSGVIGYVLATTNQSSKKPLVQERFS